ncbi:hypothetical protein [Prosthecobacter sp.]|uniref:hypothetical protein n=1 Tax=Prosthecobacter sp. TaxID=1965333 RepID=UPI002AB8DAF6|nr:hypothetical protein [Prosthecobacter sp.]MDZ4406083.1 hypothetical protein [Prosthecobacter sp.]
MSRHTAETLFLSALGATTVFVVLWLNAKETSRIALELASERALRVDVLEGELSEKEQQLASLEAVSQALQKPADILQNCGQHRSVLSFLFKFKEGAFMEVSNELSISQANAQGLLRELEIDFHLIDRIGKTAQGHIIYAPNEKGLAYAGSHNWTPGNQTMSEIRASEAERELEIVRASFSSTFQQLADANNETVELTKKLDAANACIASLQKEQQLARLPPKPAGMAPLPGR